MLRRVFGVRPHGTKARLHGRLWELAEQVTPAGRADRFNQAIMDLGATICRARKPGVPALPGTRRLPQRPAKRETQ